MTAEDQGKSGKDKGQPPGSKGPPDATSSTPSAAKATTGTGQLPVINFSTFILSLNSSALLGLGAIEDPNTGRKEKDFSLAKQTIDILAILKEKTQGNLNKDEENLLHNMLYELRLIYVKETR